MKIVVLDGFALNPGDLSWDLLNPFGEVTIYERTHRDDVLKHAEDAEILFTNKTLLKEEQLSALPKLKYIGVLATGYNIVDVAYAKERGIVVTNVPTYGTKILSLNLFLRISLRYATMLLNMHSPLDKGKWNRNEDFVIGIIL